ncbi:fucose-binding protein [Pseudoroseomonas wenyumeiae]|uniref:Fucose-binding protein n=1 Tax=Teichococcus wenyumeiae TaxID=2478470 RepID=A0A3A9JGW6_9PROT|nr:RbsD/FucU domain-containing protein [Pseudoroseomonas wenyumeiae]RKK03765.1 fucose-binding protein [Pseudoroseomonas wenyumeiae]RMI17049.1 fucose-binding protein [Pseudoroseomonas wenyumeiae]
MLKSIHPILSPDLLWVLASMGHGDDLVLVDANHPAAAIARSTASGRLVTLPGLRMAEVAAAILTVLPIDDFEPAPVRRMEVIGAPEELPPVQREVQAELARAVPGLEMRGLERFAFYDAARAGFAVVQVGDARPYGCFLLRKGIVAA